MNQLEYSQKTIEYFTDNEIINTPVGTEFIFDVECYSNYFLVAMKCLSNQKVITFEKSYHINTFNLDKLKFVLWRFCFIGFNSNFYDLPIITAALEDKTPEELHLISTDIIANSINPFAFEKKYKLNILKINSIDLIEVCPLEASLKTYSGRLHCKRMQDLPFDPFQLLEPVECEILKNYCINDLENTELLYHNLKDQINLRRTLSKEYSLDLRSKSDAQIAEAVIVSETEKFLGYRPKKPKIPVGTSFHYKTPSYINFTHPVLKQILLTIQTARFIINENGSPKPPVEFENLKFKINNTEYQVGIGGLHSCEKSVCHIASKDVKLFDFDVESYYPRIVLNQQLTPSHMKGAFLKVFESIVSRRIEAKRAKNSIVADSLKITINGSFGKFGSKYSALYAPDLMLQVTISGQLSLLMLIEWLEWSGIPVVSANTDGIVIKCPTEKVDQMKYIISLWEERTNFKTEETNYSALYSRDINNYIAVKTDGKCKTKGAYANPWNDPKSAIFRFHKNPQTTICIEAIIDFITNRSSIEHYITSNREIEKFISVRNVKGGAVKDSVYLGKVVRFYYAKGERGFIEYKKNGNKVPKSDGAKPLMDLPIEFPNDIDYSWYIKEAEKILYELGYFKKRRLF